MKYDYTKNKQWVNLPKMTPKERSSNPIAILEDSANNIYKKF